jgi:hypothetical protein
MSSFLTPKEIAENMVEIGKKKSEMPFGRMLVLGILAGLYIGFGAEVYLMVSHDLAARFGIGFMRFIRGSVFTAGLMLVVIAGAELFTGNCLMVIGVWTRQNGRSYGSPDDLRQEGKSFLCGGFLQRHCLQLPCLCCDLDGNSREGCRRQTPGHLFSDNGLCGQRL